MNTPPANPQSSRHATLLRVVFVLVIAVMLGDIVSKGVLPSFRAQKTDFTDVYIGSAQWLRGADPYDVQQATALSRERTGSEREIRLLYPPSTFVVAAPLALLPWPWASGLMGLLGLLAVVVSGISVSRLADAPLTSVRGLGLIAFTVAFAPLHVAAELSNISLHVTGLCLLAAALAHARRLRIAGVLAGLAICLKPQLAAWLLAYLLLSGTASVALWAIGIAFAGAAVGLLRLGMTPWTALGEMRANMALFQVPGGLNDISAANPGHLHMIHLPVLAMQLWGNWWGTPILAASLIAVGMAAWLVAVARRRTLPPALVLSALAGLLLLAMYHRVYDVGVLLPALAWAWSARGEASRGERLALTLMLGALIPLRSLLYRIEPSLTPGLRDSWIWQGVLLPHYTWIVGATTVLLLAAMLRRSSARQPVL